MKNSIRYILLVIVIILVIAGIYILQHPSVKPEPPAPTDENLENETVVGFRVNYNDTDTEAFEEELAREFGIAYQHTKVILTGDNNYFKSPESWDKDRYIQEINKHLNQ